MVAQSTLFTTESSNTVYISRWGQFESSYGINVPNSLIIKNIVKRSGYVSQNLRILYRRRNLAINHLGEGGARKHTPQNKHSVH